MKVIWNRKSQGYGTDEEVSLTKKEALHAIANAWARLPPEPPKKVKPAEKPKPKEKDTE